MAIIRSQHWTDIPVERRDRRRNILKYKNFKRPDSSNINKLRAWEQASLSVGAVQGVPDHWQGNFDFSHTTQNGAAQLFFGDSTDPTNTALWGMRRSDNPRAWVNFKLLNVNAVSPQIYSAAKAVRWQEVKTSTDLIIQANRHGFRKVLVLHDNTAPLNFRFAMRIPVGYTYQVLGGSIIIMDDSGETQILTRTPWARDSSPDTDLPEVGGEVIRTVLTEGNPITVNSKTYPTFWISTHPGDMASAVFPVYVDPTTVISGVSDIDDAGLLGNTEFNKTRNTGGAATRHAAGSGPRSWVCRIKSDAIPDSANYLGFTANITTLGTNPQQTLDFFIITESNDWVEGTQNIAPESGSCCYNDKALPTDWTGGQNGCRTPTTDYDTSPTVSFTNPVSAGVRSVDLPVGWLDDWKNQARTNNGYVARDNGSLDNIVQVNTSGNETGPRNYIVDYEAGGGAPVGSLIVSLKRRIL